jgi:hypothetical protein
MMPVAVTVLAAPFSRQTMHFFLASLPTKQNTVHVYHCFTTQNFAF